MKLKGRYIIDLDSTLNNLCPVWLSWYNTDYDDTLTPEDIKSWATHQYVKPECGTDIYDYLHFPELFQELEPTAGSQEAVEGLIRDGLDILVVSACTPASYLPKVGFLHKYFPFIPKDNFIAANRKDLVIANGIVDDKYEAVAKFPGFRILYSQPWNVAEYEANGVADSVINAAGWQEVDLRIRSLAYDYTKYS